MVPYLFHAKSMVKIRGPHMEGQGGGVEEKVGKY